MCVHTGRPSRESAVKTEQQKIRKRAHTKGASDFQQPLNQNLTLIPSSIARGVVPSMENCPKFAGALVAERSGSSSWL